MQVLAELKETGATKKTGKMRYRRTRETTIQSRIRPSEIACSGPVGCRAHVRADREDPLDPSRRVHLAYMPSARRRRTKARAVADLLELPTAAGWSIEIMTSAFCRRRAAPA